MPETSVSRKAAAQAAMAATSARRNANLITFAKGRRIGPGRWDAPVAFRVCFLSRRTRALSFQRDRPASVLPIVVSTAAGSSSGADLGGQSHCLYVV